MNDNPRNNPTGNQSDKDAKASLRDRAKAVGLDENATEAQVIQAENKK